MRRTGAQRIADIPPDVLAALNRGELESVNLVEGLAIDMVQLAEVGVPEVAETARSLKDEGVVARSRGIGEALRGQCNRKRLSSLARHTSDTIRCWACHALVGAPGLTLADRLEAARPFAVDDHMGVREIAWAAARPFYSADLSRTFRLLEPWVHDENEYARRFAVEGTRPRGVWCRHITELKDDPASGLVVLDPLRSDPSRYVQNAVGNWLNDASKSRPEWVVDVCARWSRDSSTPETKYIARRALRTLRKA